LKTKQRVAPGSIRLRGTTVPVIAVMLRDTDPQRLEAELQQKIDEASGSLAGGLGVIDVAALGEHPLDLGALAAMVRRLGLHPCAVQGADAAYEQQARALGLAFLPAEPAGVRQLNAVKQQAERREANPPAEVTHAPTARAQSAPPRPEDPRSAMVITQPLRSGQRVYARGRDLVLLSSASPGSELIADGHIHCYGPLRGRAVAGASGDGTAQVFALDFQAELVSIAGVYKAFEALPPELDGKAVRVSLRPDGAHPHIDVAPLADR
jgi:septum site-determining protein MinC